MGRMHNKRSAGRHVQLAEWLQSSEAWRSLKPGPRALYVELKRRFNGSNNGEIYLSHRDAARELNVNRKTVGGYFNVLIEQGFIIQTMGHCLGPAGVGQSGSYALTEHPLHGQPATKEFMSFKKQKPRAKTTHSLSQKTDQAGVKNSLLENQKSKKRAAFAQDDPLHRGKKRDIYTSSHIPNDQLPENVTRLNRQFEDQQAPYKTEGQSGSQDAPGPARNQSTYIGKQSREPDEDHRRPDEVTHQPSSQLNRMPLSERLQRV